MKPQGYLPRHIEFYSEADAEIIAYGLRYLWINDAPRPDLHLVPLVKVSAIDVVEAYDEYQRGCWPAGIAAPQPGQWVINVIYRKQDTAKGSPSEELDGLYLRRFAEEYCCLSNMHDIAQLTPGIIWERVSAYLDRL